MTATTELKIICTQESLSIPKNFDAAHSEKSTCENGFCTNYDRNCIPVMKIEEEQFPKMGLIVEMAHPGLQSTQMRLDARRAARGV